MTGVAAALARTGVSTRPMGELPVKGKGEITVFVITHSPLLASDLDFRDAGKLEQFRWQLGNDSEASSCCGSGSGGDIAMQSAAIRIAPNEASGYIGSGVISKPSAATAPKCAELDCSGPRCATRCRRRAALCLRMRPAARAHHWRAAALSPAVKVVAPISFTQ
jgi:hypothetical protein